MRRSYWGQKICSRWGIEICNLIENFFAATLKSTSWYFFFSSNKVCKSWFGQCKFCQSIGVYGLRFWLIPLWNSMIMVTENFKHSKYTKAEKFDLSRSSDDTIKRNRKTGINVLRHCAIGKSLRKICNSVVSFKTRHKQSIKWHLRVCILSCLKKIEFDSLETIKSMHNCMVIAIVWLKASLAFQCRIWNLHIV